MTISRRSSAAVWGSRRIPRSSMRSSGTAVTCATYCLRVPASCASASSSRRTWVSRYRTRWPCWITAKPMAWAKWLLPVEDGLFQGPPGTGKSHLAQAIGFAVIQQGHRVLYRETHVLLEELAEAQLAGTRKPYVAQVTAVPLLLIDDLGMRRLPHTAAEDLLEIVMRRYEKASTLITSNRPVEDWGKLLGDTAAVAALLDRLLHHAHEQRR